LARRVTNLFTKLIGDRPRRDVCGIETLCREVGKDLVGVFGPRERKDLPAEAENISGMVELAALPFEVNKVTAYSGDKRQSGQARNKLFQQLDTLGYEIERDLGYSRDIALGRARFFTSPLSIGSLAVEMMGIVAVACMRARTVGVLAPNSTSGRRATNSAASAGACSNRP